MSSQTQQLKIFFDSDAEAQVTELILDKTVYNKSKFIRQLNLSKFYRQRPEQNIKIENFHLRIRCQCRSNIIRDNLFSNAELHTIYSSPHIQNYYSVLKNLLNQFKLTIQAEIYRYTLADIIIELKKKSQKLAAESMRFIIYSIIQIYKYLMYIIAEKDSSFKNLEYQIFPQNLGFSESYKLMLLNPCMSNLNKQYHPSKMPNKFLQLKQQIYYTLVQISQIAEELDQFSLKFMAWVKKQLTDQIFTLEDYKKHQKSQLRQFEIQLGHLNIPQHLWKYLMNKFEPEIRLEKSNVIFNRIAKQQQNNLGRLKKKFEDII